MCIRDSRADERLVLEEVDTEAALGAEEASTKYMYVYFEKEVRAFMKLAVSY